MKPTLLILAAGMGSRYGGLKQLGGVGPSGETIMDYSLYDAIRAGFGKVLFVIRKDFEKDFMAQVARKYQERIPVEIAFQSVDKLPEGFTCPPGRTKPWGTNHAVLMGRDLIKEPFAVINADDFYGKESFQVLAEELRQMEGTRNRYCMVGYHVGNTLSSGGGVSRGICQYDAEGFLTSVTERTDIRREEDGVIRYQGDAGERHPLSSEMLVSMNMWGFTPDYFEHSLEAFQVFLRANLESEKGEFYIPTVVNQLIQSGTSKVRVLDTPSKWFGVTYATDRPSVTAQLQTLVEQGEYPQSLFGA